MTHKILPYALVVLLAYIGFSLPLPILPEMFLDPVYSIVPTLSSKQKMVALGFIMASFPCGQFFGSPIIGHFSDVYGRKKIILYSLAGTLLGYLLTAYAVCQKSLGGMFLGLALCGFFEGNVTIGQSVVVDLIDNPAQKARHFGILNACISLGFIIGPLMGGLLTNSSVVSWFSFSTPFWAAACMTALGMLTIFFYSKETLQRKKERDWKFFTAALKSFNHPKLFHLYTANFFLALGYFSFFRFLPVFLKERFAFTPSYLSFVMVYGSLMMILSVFSLVPFLAKRFSSQHILALFAIFFAAAVVLCILPSAPEFLWFTIPLTGFCLAVTITNGSLLISNATSLDFQGQALGTLTSIQVLAEVVTGCLGGLIAAEMRLLPLLIGAAMSCVCAIILFLHNRRKNYV